MGRVVKNPPANAGDSRDMGPTPGSGRSPGGGRGNPPQYSRLENPRDRRAWWATVHRAAEWAAVTQRARTGGSEQGAVLFSEREECAGRGLGLIL